VTIFSQNKGGIISSGMYYTIFKKTYIIHTFSFRSL